MNIVLIGEESAGIQMLWALKRRGHSITAVIATPSKVPSAGAFVQEVLKGREAMKQVVGLEVSDNFAYPFGRVSAAAKRDVGRAMRSCRGIYPGVNGPVLDLSLLRANSLYGDTEQLGLIRRLFQASQERSGWIIFYTHDVRNIHSPWGCTPALLEAVVKLALNRSMRILTCERGSRRPVKSGAKL